MAAKKKNSTIKTIVIKAGDVASTVLHAADDHLIHPVGEALGLIKKPEPKVKPARSPVRKGKLNTVESKKPSGKKALGAKARMMSKPVPASKVTKKPASQSGPGPKQKSKAR